MLKSALENDLLHFIHIEHGSTIVLSLHLREPLLKLTQMSALSRPH